MTGWKRWFYSKMSWEYDPPADEKQKRQKYLLTEQIKNSKIKEEVVHYKRPDTPVPVAMPRNPRELWNKEIQDQTRILLSEIEQDLVPSKKSRRKRKTKDN
jgi:hypothetical protein